MVLFAVFMSLIIGYCAMFAPTCLCRYNRGCVRSGFMLWWKRCSNDDTNQPQSSVLNTKYRLRYVSTSRLSLASQCISCNRADSRSTRASYNDFVTLTPKLQRIFIPFSSIKVQITGPASKVENLVKYNTNPKKTILNSTTRASTSSFISIFFPN